VKNLASGKMRAKAPYPLSSEPYPTKVLNNTGFLVRILVKLLSKAISWTRFSVREPRVRKYVLTYHVAPKSCLMKASS
jgi:hypothetical protein